MKMLLIILDCTREQMYILFGFFFLETFKGTIYISFKQQNHAKFILEDYYLISVYGWWEFLPDFRQRFSEQVSSSYCLEAHDSFA